MILLSATGATDANDFTKLNLFRACARDASNSAEPLASVAPVAGQVGAL